MNGSLTNTRYIHEWPNSARDFGGGKQIKNRMRRIDSAGLLEAIHRKSSLRFLLPPSSFFFFSCCCWLLATGLRDWKSQVNGKPLLELVLNQRYHLLQVIMTVFFPHVSYFWLLGGMPSSKKQKKSICNVLEVLLPSHEWHKHRQFVWVAYQLLLISHMHLYLLLKKKRTQLLCTCSHKKKRREKILNIIVSLKRRIQ